MLYLFTAMSVVAVILLTSAYWMYQNVTGANISNSEIVSVSNAIKLGAYTYLSKQYKIITAIGILCSLLIAKIFGFYTCLAFVVGAFLSGFASAISMMIAVDSNVFITQSAITGGKLGNRKTSLMFAFKTAMKAGGVIGFIVNGFGIFGISLLLLLTSQTSVVEFTRASLGFCLGVSLISVFARLGGGIFTKAADIGADLVGKLESNIPEDDYRNPAVIADNVGDNVGDCAGMAADVFETYAVSLIAAIQVSLILFDKISISEIVLPYIVLTMSICGLVSIGTVLCSKLIGSVTKSVFRLLNQTIYISFVLTSIATWILFEGQEYLNYVDPISSMSYNLNWYHLVACSAVGFVITKLFMHVTDRYTSFKHKSVQEIAKASKTGAATNVIYGLSVGMESVVMPSLLVIIAIVMCYKLAGVFGIAVAVVSMISLTSIIMTLDAYGPITDNAGGIAEMSKLDSEVRSVTDELDAVGNTTKAVTKGYAIGSAALATLVLFFTFVFDVKITNFVSLSLLNPYILVGLLVGGLLPFWFGAMSMKAVGRIGGLVVLEVRDQLSCNPGILAGTQKPNYKRTIATITNNALKAMIIPALLPVLTPIVLAISVYFCQADQAVFSLAGMMIGVLVTGFFLALMMTNSGGAWDNAKKLVESGEFGGKKGDAYQATVIGDTIGDPFKDTAGPAINPMIKVVSIVSLLIAGLL